MIKTSTPADTDTGAAIIAQMLTNDKQNLTQDENAVLNSGISEGMVVKWSPGRSKWLLCDGTVALSDTDSIGIVTYADGTSGQVKTSGVYVNDELSTVGKYYCQSDGSIGTTITKVFIGNITSPGRLCLPGGSGGGGNIATATSLGQVQVGTDLEITDKGVLSVSAALQNLINAKLQNSSIAASLSPTSGYIKIPNSTGNNFIVQAFQASTNNLGTTFVTFPNAFPNACIAVVAFSKSNADIVQYCTITDTSRCQIKTQNGNGTNCFVIAIGY